MLPDRGVAKVTGQVAALKAGEGQGRPVIRRRIVNRIGYVFRIHVQLQVAQHALNIGDQHGVGSGGQAAEGVLAIGIGGLGGDDIATVVQQGNGDAGDAGFIGILTGIGIGIEEDRIAYDVACRGFVAKVGVDEHVAGREHHGIGRAVIRTATVRIASLGPGLAIGAWQAGRIDDHGVGAGRQAIEDVVAGGIGRGGSHGRFVARAEQAVGARALQRDGDAANAGLALVLTAVTVHVVPDTVADGAGGSGPRVGNVTRRNPVVAEVGGQVVFAFR